MRPVSWSPLCSASGCSGCTKGSAASLPADMQTRLHHGSGQRQCHHIISGVAHRDAQRLMRLKSSGGENIPVHNPGCGSEISLPQLLFLSIMTLVYLRDIMSLMCTDLIVPSRHSLPDKDIQPQIFWTCDILLIWVNVPQNILLLECVEATAVNINLTFWLSIWLAVILLVCGCHFLSVFPSTWSGMLTWTEESEPHSSSDDPFCGWLRVLWRNVQTSQKVQHVVFAVCRRHSP